MNKLPTPPSPDSETEEPTEGAAVNYGEVSPQPTTWTYKLFSKLFASIEYPHETAQQLRELSQTHTLIYTSRIRSAWLALYLNHAFKTLGLPLATFVGSISLWLWEPLSRLWEFWRRKSPHPPEKWVEYYNDKEATEKEIEIANTTYRGKSVFFVLNPPRTVGRSVPKYKDDFIRALVAVQRASDKPLCIVPHILTDRTMGSSGDQSITDRIFGDRRRPGRLRSLAIRIQTLRTATIRIGEPLKLDVLLDENPEMSDSNITKKIRHILNRTMNEEERVIAGPDLPSYISQERHVLRNELVRSAITTVGEETGQSPAELEERAAKLLQEIAARFNVKYIKFLDRLLHVVFNRIYDGIICDSEGLKKVLDASRKGPVVFCPCHRSHVDYLVLSHTLWRTGVIPPHIAAGVNLSFFPLGTIFRGCGAFFLRRSFKGDLLYSAVFRSYVMELLGAGTSIEFFLEGTRSRTGKLLMPKFGILGMIVEAFRRNAREDIQFVPVSIDYEKIIEAKSYERELSGGKKKKEDLTALLKTTSVLRSKFGRMHVQFGDPISLKDFADERELPASIESEHDELWKANTERLGYQILHGISKTCTVTPIAVVATVLLSNKERGITKSRLLERSTDFIDFLYGASARFSEALESKHTAQAALAEAVEKLVDDNQAAVDRDSRGSSEPIYHIPEENRILLDYHKNSIINHFAANAILARVMLHHKSEVLQYEKIRKECRFLSRLFKREFVYPVGSIFANVFDENLATLAVRGILDVNDDNTITIRRPERLDSLAGFLDNFIEGYWVTANQLKELRTFPLWQKELVSQTQERIRRAYLQGNISRPEAVNSTLIQSALRWFQDSGVIESRTAAKRTTLSLSKHYSGDALEKLIDSIARYL